MDKEEMKELRKSLNAYLTLNGVKQGYLCQLLGIDQSILSKFKCGKKDLFDKHARLLKDYLKSKDCY